MSVRNLSSTHRPGGHPHPRRLAVLLAVAGLAAAACSPPPAADKQADPVDKESLPDCPLDALEKATEPVELTVWYGGLSGIVEQNLQDQVAGFNASQDKVVATAQSQGSSFDQTLQKFESTTDDQRPQVAYLENTALRRLVDGGDIFPVEACMKADGFDLGEIRAPVRSYFTVNDVFWPGYVNVSGPILYYNAVQFQSAGLDPAKPPSTVAELRTAAEALKADGVEKPLALLLNEHWTESWLNGVGIDMVNESNGRDASPTKATFNTPEAVELWTLLKEMKDDGLLEPFSATDGMRDQYFAVATRKSTMVIETSTASTTIKQFLSEGLDPEEFGAGDVPVDTEQILPMAAPFPGIDEPGKIRQGGAGFFIAEAASPEEKAAAWKYLQYMLETPQGIAWHLKGSYLPWLEPVEESPEVQKFWAEELDGGMLKIASDMLDEVDPFQPGPLIGPYPEYTAAIKAALDEVMFKDVDPSKALDDAEKRVNESLDRYNG